MSSWRIKTSPQSEEVRFSIWSVDVTLTDCDNVNKSLYRERQDKNKSKNLQQGKSYMFYPNAHVILLYLYCSILCIVFEKWIISCHISKQVCRAAAAAAKLLQSCLTLCNPIYGSPPGSPSLGFSRQEYWSGLPFPSPMHESEKRKWSHSVVSDSLRPHGLQPTRLLRPWDSPGKSTGVGCHIVISNCSLPMWSGDP